MGRESLKGGENRLLAKEGDEMIANNNGKVKSNSEVNLAEILLYCMKANPSDVLMINGATGEKFTNENILKRSVSLACSLQSQGRKGTTVLLVVKNHQHMAVLYYGTIFSGILPLLVDPNSTAYELKYFIKLVTPTIIFCDRDNHSCVLKAVRDVQFDTEVVIADDVEKIDYFFGSNEDIDNFKLPDFSPCSPVLLLPTSGSTGHPKATVLHHEGLVTQLPSIWTYTNKLPTPTDVVMVISTAQWMTHTIFMTTCPVYKIPMLMWPLKSNSKVILEMVDKYKPTCTLLGPAVTSLIASTASTSQLASLQLVFVSGSPMSQGQLESIKEKFSKLTYICNNYGMTENHGTIILSEKNRPMNNSGRILNFTLYKLMDENEQELGVYEKGELYVKSRCVFKGYWNNEEATKECITSDGWLKTGDIFYEDKEEILHFVARKKFHFKYLNYHISPEEVENVIGEVPGVQQSVVCATEKGAAAAVVLQRLNYDVTREDINRAVNSKLSEHKHLYGGIAFVPNVPHFSSGKLDRRACTDMIQELIQKGKCY